MHYGQIVKPLQEPAIQNAKFLKFGQFREFRFVV